MIFSSGFAKLLTASAVGPLFLFMASPVLSRLYSPDQYGVFGVGLTICTTLSVVLALRFELVYLKRREKIENVLAIGLVLIVITSLSSVVLLNLTNAFERVAIDVDAVFWLLLFSTGLISFYGHMIVAEKDYTTFSKAKILQSIMQVGAAILLGLAGASAGLIWALILAQFLFLFFSYCRRRDGFVFQGAYGFFLKNRVYAFKNSCAGLFQFSSPAAPVILIFYYLGKEDIGFYFFVVQVFSAPAAILRRSLYHFVTAELSEGSSKQLIRVMLRYKILFILSLFLVFFAVIILYFFGADIFGFVFGGEWARSGGLAWFVALYFFIDTAMQPFCSLLALWGKENLYFGIEVLRFFLVFFVPIAMIELAGISPSVINICLITYSCMIFIYLFSFACLMGAKK